MDETARARIITLRYAGVCGCCESALVAGVKASWDKASKTATCLDCVGTGSAPTVGETAPVEAFLPAPNPHVRAPAVNRVPSRGVEPRESVAGGSAQAEADRRHRKREQRLDAKWGRFAGVAKFLSDDPQSTKAWARGAEGERRLANHLTQLLGDRAVFLHDRKVGRANIDHLIVASSGVWVVDAKLYAGQVEYRNKGGWLGPADWRIYVGGRDKTKLAIGLAWQVTAVRKALAGVDAPVHPALCFVDSDWGWFAKPFRHEGVLVTWSKKLAEMIGAPGNLGPDEIERIVERLKQELRPAT